MSANRERDRASWRKYRSKDPEKHRRRAHRWSLKQRGTNLEEYEKLFREQKGLCAACGKPETAVSHGRTRNLAFDHCHVTGANRGLLCFRCNMSLGYAQDDPNILRRLVRYLARFQKARGI